MFEQSLFKNCACVKLFGHPARMERLPVAGACWAVVVVHTLLHTCSTMNTCRTAERVTGCGARRRRLTVTQRWHTTIRSPCVGIERADLPRGARANAFTDDEKVDYRYEQDPACEQHYARSCPTGRRCRT